MPITKRHHVMLFSLLLYCAIGWLWRSVISPPLFMAVADRAHEHIVFLRPSYLKVAQFLIFIGANPSPWLTRDRSTDFTLCHAKSADLDPVYDEDWGRLCLSKHTHHIIMPTDSQNLRPSAVLIAAIAKNESAETIEDIIAWGVDINQPSMGGVTALRSASCSNRVDVIDILIRHGLVLNRDEVFYSLQCAIMRNHMAAVVKLLQTGISPDVTTDEFEAFHVGGIVSRNIAVIPTGSNLAHIACYFRRFDIANVLARYNVSMTLMNADGKSPEELCKTLPAWNEENPDFFR